MIESARDPFSGPNLFPPDTPGIQPPNGVNPSPSYQDMVNQMGTFETPMQDKYQGLLSARPEREQPGLMRALVASGMGLGEKSPGNAFKTQEEVMFAPYNREMADWTSQVEPAYKSAQLENTANANERAMRGTILTNKTNMDRYEDMNTQASRRNDITESRNRDLARIADRKNEIEAGWRLGYTYTVEGNKLIAHAPDGSSFDTGQTNEDFSPMALARYRHKATMEEIGKRTEGAVEVKGTPSGTPTGGASGNPVVQRNMRFQNVYDTDEDAAQWLIPPATTNGTWQFKPEPKGGMLTGSKDIARQKVSWKRAKQLVNAGTTGVAPSGASATTKKAPPIGGSNTPPAAVTKLAPPPSSTRTLSPDEFVGPEFIASEEERTRANLRSKVVTAKANEEEELNKVINDPKSPNQIKIAAKRRLESLRYDKSQNPSNVIEDASKSQPNERRKSTDGGKTWQYSHDGGKTWGNE
jgi:hypothetical protein